MRNGVDEIIRRMALIARPRNVRKAVENAPIGGFQLHIGNALAEAYMRAGAEGKMVFDIVAVHVHAVGVDKHIRVAIGRAVIHHDFFAGHNLLAGELGFGQRRAAHIHNR